MSSKHTFPQNKTLQARMQCVIEAFGMCRSALDSVNTCLDEIGNDQVRKMLKKVIDEASENAKLASQAISE